MLTIDVLGQGRALQVYGTSLALSKIYGMPAIDYTSKDPYAMSRGKPEALFPPSLRIANTLIKKYQAQLSPRGKAWYKKLQIEHSSAKACLEPTGGELDERLFALQDIGVQFLQAQERVLLADEQGTGKTVTSLTAIKPEILSGGNCLILCLKGLAPQWISHIKEWVGEDVTIHNMTKVYKRKERFIEYNSKPGSITVMNWDALPTLREVLDSKEGKKLRWTCIIGDESHMIQNRKAQRTKVMFQISQMCDYLYLLTGTPQEEHPANLWAQLHCLYPKIFTSYWAFYSTFVKYRIDFMGGIEESGPKNSTILHDVIYPFYLRRTLREVAPDLSEARFVTVPVEIPKKQKELYALIEEEHTIELDDGSIVSIPNMLSQMTKLRQCLVDVDLIINQGKSISGKLDTMKDILSGLGEKERAVIFCSFRKGCENGAARVGKEGIVYFTDKDPQILKDFQEGRGPRFLFTTPDSSGTGSNLQIASIAIFLDLPWRLILYKQACNRIVRIGQTKVPIVYHLHAPGSFDDIVYTLMQDKTASFNEVIISRKILENRRLVK